MRIKILLLSFLLFCGFVNIASASEEATVLVKTETMSMRTLSDTLKGYGVVTPDVGSAVNINFLRPGKVVRLFVSAGQAVRRGQDIVEFATEPAAIQAYQQAEAAIDQAGKELKRTEEMAAEGFATKSQVTQAKRALSDAQAALATQEKTGAGRQTETLKAPFDGIVTSIPVTQGDSLQAGATIMQLAHPDALRVQIGIEPEDLNRVKPGMPVLLTPVFAVSCAINAKIDEVQNIINPQTQLVDAIVRLHGFRCNGIIPGTRMQASIKISGSRTWTVPRDAVLRDDNGYYIYQVSKGKAQKSYVKRGIETDTVVGISGSFNPRLKVVVQGNYELQDGMSVRER
jgi:membrane fusion protein, multidrug efflux system